MRICSAEQTFSDKWYSMKNFQTQIDTAIAALNVIREMGNQVEQGLISHNEFVLNSMVQQNISNCAITVGVKQHAEKCEAQWSEQPDEMTKFYAGSGIIAGPSTDGVDETEKFYNGEL